MIWIWPIDRKKPGDLPQPAATMENHFVQLGIYT